MKMGLVVGLLLATTAVAGAQYLGNLSSNPYAPNSTSNPYGAGNPYNPNSVTNPYGQYGNPYSPNSAKNPYATNAPRLYDGDGNYRGGLSTTPMILTQFLIPMGGTEICIRRTASTIHTEQGIPIHRPVHAIRTAPASEFTGTMMTSSVRPAQLAGVFGKIVLSLPPWLSHYLTS